MHLPKAFFRLPRRFDIARLREEVAALPDDAWVPHPNGVPGNSSVRLITADGGENDGVDGVMRETLRLGDMPYVRQVLASFGVPWSRSRLLRLAPGAGVPLHADINYHWFYRVRMHVPIVTREEVRFHCDGSNVHMAAGEAWVFDNWRLHHVVNPTNDERIHLVADTAGSAAFWQLVGSSDDSTALVTHLPFRPSFRPTLLTERSTLRPVMNPAELELLVGNLRGELISLTETADSRLRLSRYHSLLDAFVRDWRGYYSLHGEEPSGRGEFERLRDSVRAASRTAGEGLSLRTNRVAAHKVLEGRALRVCVAPEGATTTIVPAVGTPVSVNPRAADSSRLARPVIIVAAPRSGSTLLFETLASSGQVATLGGEAHWLIETIAELCPGAPGVDSNRLTAAHATPRVVERIRSQVLERLVDRRRQLVPADRTFTFLEKTPKNALRIPFLKQVFPDARFVFLWREPRGNLSSIMDAWRSGRWRTYPRLEGFPLPWSLLLPPGWETMHGRSLEELAAFQWTVTNRTVLDDLESLPTTCWTAVEYAELTENPAATLRRLCRFAGLDFDDGIAERVSGPLPQATHTLTPARPDKWKSNQAEIARILPGAEGTWQRLRSIAEAKAVPCNDGLVPLGD
jgi:hypothetical protein